MRYLTLLTVLTLTLLPLTGCTLQGSQTPPAPAADPVTVRQAPQSHARAREMAAEFAPPAPPGDCTPLDVECPAPATYTSLLGTSTNTSFKFLVPPGGVILIKGKPGWSWEGATTVSEDGSEASWYCPGKGPAHTLTAVQPGNG